MSNLKQVGTAGQIYLSDYDDTCHLYRDAAGHGWYVMLEPYVKSKEMSFDAMRGVSVTFDASNNWTNFTTLASNRNGWLGYEGFTPPATFFPRQYRTASSQENVAQRAAYMIVARPTALNQGYDFITDEAGCAVTYQPTTVANTRFNRVYLAAQFHRDRIITSYGDSHAGGVPFSKVGKLNTSPTTGVNDASDCAGYGPTKHDYQDHGIDLNYWGTWDDATH